MRMRRRFHEQKNTQTPPTEETPESRHENSPHCCTLMHQVHTATVQHPNHAKTLASKHVRSSIYTEMSQASEYSRNQASANERAIEFGDEPALVVPIDRNVPHQLHEQRTKSCAWRASGQEEQEPRRVEADRQPGLQTSSSRGVQSDVLPLGREESWSGGTNECGGGALQEQSATERPASPRPHQITKPHLSSAQIDSDARLRFALRGGKGRGGSAQQSPCSTTQPSPTELKTILTYCASPYRWEERWEHAPSFIQTRSQQTCLVFESIVTLSPQRPHDTDVLRAGSGSAGARGASQGRSCSNEVGQIHTKSCDWETHGKYARSHFLREFQAKTTTLIGVWCSCGCPSSSCPRGRRGGGESSELAGFLGRHVGHESAGQQRRRVSEYSQPSAPFQPRLDRTCNLKSAKNFELERQQLMQSFCFRENY